MEKYYFDLMNNYFRDNPVGMLIAGTLILLVYKLGQLGIKAWWEKYTGKRKTEQAHKDESRTTIDWIKAKVSQEMVTKGDMAQMQSQVDGLSISCRGMEKHLLDINGSIKQHHDDSQIHFTEDKCFQRHHILLKEFNETISKYMVEIFTKIDKLSEKVNVTEGRLDANDRGHNAT